MLKKLGIVAALMVLGSVVFTGAAQAAPAAGPTTTNAAAAAFDPDWRCDDSQTGYYCLYPDGGFGGVPQVYSACGSYNLNVWDVASSWKSKQTGGAWVEVFSYPPGTPEYLWSMPAGAQSSSVAGNVNDRADYVDNHC